MCDKRYNPHAVSPTVIQRLSIADREEIISRQQCYIPLDGRLVEALEKAERSKQNANS
jgi:hypothetical protein